MVETAEQAGTALVRERRRYRRAACAASAASAARSSRWSGVAGYAQQADAQICLLVQAESVTAVANLDAIAAVKSGSTASSFGPADLSASVGLSANRPSARRRGDRRRHPPRRRGRQGARRPDGRSQARTPLSRHRRALRRGRRRRVVAGDGSARAGRRVPELIAGGHRRKSMAVRWIAAGIRSAESPPESGPRPRGSMDRTAPS